MALSIGPYAKAPLTNPDEILNDFILVIDLSTLDNIWWNKVDTTVGAKGRASVESSGVELATDWYEFNDVAKTGFVRVAWIGQQLTTGIQEVRIYAPQAANSTLAKTDPFGSDACYDPANTLFYSPDGGNSDRSSNTFVLTENNGVVSGGSSGKVGPSTSFDGVNQFLDGTIPDQNQPMTIMAWNKSDGFSASTIAGMSRNDNTFDFFALGKAGDFGRSTFGEVGVGNYSISGLDDAPNDIWFHHTSVFSESTIFGIYQNGVLSRSFPGLPGDPIITNLSIGYINTPSGVYFNGNIQEVMMFTDEKSPAWIAQEYAQTNDNAAFWGAWTTVIPASTAFVFDFRIYNKSISNIGEVDSVAYARKDLIENDGKSTLPFG